MMRLFTAKELAVELRISVQTLYRMVTRGQIPCVHLGGSLRFEEESILEWMKNGQAASYSEKPRKSAKAV